MDEEDVSDLVRVSGNLSARQQDAGFHGNVRCEVSDNRTILRIGENHYYSIRLVIGECATETVPKQDSTAKLAHESEPNSTQDGLMQSGRPDLVGVNRPQIRPELRTVEDEPEGPGPASESSREIWLDSDAASNSETLPEENFDDLLQLECGRFFRQRRIPGLHVGQQMALASPMDYKMSLLKREIASLMSQDDALFSQLMQLQASISELRHTFTPKLFGSSRSSSLTSLSDSDDGHKVTGDVLLPRARVAVQRNKSRALRDSLDWSSTSSTEEESLPIPEPRELIPRAKLRSSSSFSKTAMHKRQRSYDSGIQGSDPSDGEVFV